MYGLVNRAIEQMVCRDHGQECWERIRVAADVDVEGFVSTKPYPDAMTYQLVEAAEQVLGMPAHCVLHAFGEYWVMHTGLESYGPLMRAGGRNVREFLLKLPDFHTRVQLIYPQLQPPQFACSDVTAHSLHLHYRSHRRGLEPMVEGLLQGIGRMFGTQVTVRRLMDRGRGDDHSVFHADWAPQP